MKHVNVLLAGEPHVALENRRRLSNGRAGCFTNALKRHLENKRLSSAVPNLLIDFKKTVKMKCIKMLSHFKAWGHWLVYIPLLKRQTVIFILFFPVTHR